MHNYKYWGYGLKISSQIEFPELLPADFEEPEVIVELINELKDIDGKRNAIGDRLYTINKTAFLFEQKGIGRYLAENGKHILVQHDPNNKEMAMVRLVLLTSVFAAILLQRRQLPIHSSAILKDGKLTLIAGESGAGKTTTLAGLINNGHTVFSDDVVVVNNTLDVFSSYPMMKLWEDTQKKINSDRFNSQAYLIKSGVRKFGVFFHDSFITESFKISNFIILKKGSVDRIQHKKLTGIGKFSAIQAQIYRQLFIHDVDLRKFSFEIVSKLSNSCNVFEITRPELCDHQDLIKEVTSIISRQTPLLT